MAINPAPFLMAAVGCAFLIARGKQMKTDPNEHIRPLGEHLHRLGVMFSWMIGLIFILLIVDALGLIKWVT